MPQRKKIDELPLIGDDCDIPEDVLNEFDEQGEGDMEDE